MLKTLNKTLIIIWMNSIASKMIPERTKDRNVGKHLVVTNKEKLPRLERWMPLELKESWSATSLELEIKWYPNGTFLCVVTVGNCLS